MKQIYFISLAIASLLLVGCKNQQVAALGGRKAVELDKCIKVQLEDPARRAWGTAVFPNEKHAFNLASGVARANFAAMLETAILSATDQYAAQYSKSSSDGEKREMGSDYTSLDKSKIKSGVEGIVKNTKEIEQSLYQLKDGSWQAYVCIQYDGSIEDLTSTLSHMVEDQLSAEEKLKIQFDNQQFDKEIENFLKKMKHN